MYGSQHKERKSSYQFTDKPLILHLYYPLLLLIIFCHLLGLGKSERVALAAAVAPATRGSPHVTCRSATKTHALNHTAIKNNAHVLYHSATRLYRTLERLIYHSHLHIITGQVPMAQLLVQVSSSQ